MSGQSVEEALRGKGYVTVMEAAELVGMTPERVRQWIRAGDLKAVALGPRKTYVVRQDIVDRLPPEAAKALGLKQRR